MIPHHGKTQQFIQFKILLKGWATIVFGNLHRVADSSGYYREMIAA